ncbi:hypothetical protein GN956_G15612 [Arapaima gigas]
MPCSCREAAAHLPCPASSADRHPPSQEGVQVQIFIFCLSDTSGLGEGAADPTSTSTWIPTKRLGLERTRFPGAV